MPLMDIIQSFSLKHSQVYNDFIRAYTEVRQMKNVEENLFKMANCLLSEKSEGKSKCLEYYLAHDVDRVILQLHTTADVESFYCCIITVLSPGHLKTEFWCEIWKYKKFSLLCKMYCELCVEFNIFNSDLASYLMEMFYADKNAKEGLTIICKIKEYSKYLEDKGFGPKLLDKINYLLEARSLDVIYLLSFLIYYQDVTGFNFLDGVEIRTNDLNGKRRQNSAKSEISTSDISKSSPIINFQNKSFWEPFNKDPENTLIFCKELYKNIKSFYFRGKILEATTAYINHQDYSGFLIFCISVDSETVATYLSSSFDDKVAKWNPLEIYKIISEDGSECGKIINEDGSECGKIIADLLEDNTRENDSEIFKDLNVIIKNRCLSFKTNRFSLLKILLDNGFSDYRIYLFIYFIDKTYFFNNFFEIYKIVNHKKIIAQIIHQDIIRGGNYIC